jgi:NUMOD3 motif
VGILTKEHRIKLGNSHKGHIPWNKGKVGVFTEEQKKNMSDALKGHIPWNKGKVGCFNKEVRDRMSLTHKGQMYISEEGRRRISEANRGKKMNPLSVKQAWETRRKNNWHTFDETRRRMSESAIKKWKRIKLNKQNGIKQNAVRLQSSPNPNKSKSFIK